MSMESNDRRRFIRIPFKTEVRIEAKEAVIRYNGEIDISMSGLRAPCQGSLPEAATCRATIMLSAVLNDAVIRAEGRVIRSEPESIALEFTELDLDSYNHLRQLILNNAPDPERAEQEFDAHWGIKPPV